MPMLDEDYVQQYDDEDDENQPPKEDENNEPRDNFEVVFSRHPFSVTWLSWGPFHQQFLL